MGSEMCIRDSDRGPLPRGPGLHDVRSVDGVEGDADLLEDERLSA